MKDVRRPNAARVRLALALALVLLAGCTHRPAWDDDPQAATVGYWLGRPAAVHVDSGDYKALWAAADGARRRFNFPAARDDYRGGLLTSQPVVSPQPFELWRDELRTPAARLESSLSSVRRRLRFEFGRLAGGGFFVEPKVVVERESRGERRITNAIDYRRVLGTGGQQTLRADVAATTRPANYWYAIGRDAALERSLARRIAGRVGARARCGPAQDVTRRAADNFLPPPPTSTSRPTLPGDENALPNDADAPLVPRREDALPRSPTPADPLVPR